jgi:hypothetical protein
MATYFTTTPNSLSGYAYGTFFQHALNEEYDTVSWNLGDGTYLYNQRSISHAYNYPGTYQVSVTAQNFDGTLIIDQTQVVVEFACRDAIIFTAVPASFGMAGRKTTTPFVLSLTSSKVDEPVSVSLYSYGSNSAPHFAVPDRWSFITPKWRFVDAVTLEPYTDSVLVSTVPLYKDSTVVGVSGQLSFYYIDDSATFGQETETSENPLLLVATLSSQSFTYPPETQYYKHPSYSNPKTTQCFSYWHVNDCTVTKYKITENYLNDIYPIKWKDVPIPVMVTCLFEPPESPGQFVDVLGYPRTNEIGLQTPVNLALYENGFQVPSNLYEVETPLYFKKTDENNNFCSGFIFTTVTPLTSFSGSMQVGISSNKIVVQNVEEGAFPFPYSYPLYPQVFVNNNFYSNINVISFYNYNFTSSESQLSFQTYTVNVPTLSAVSVAFNEISGTAATYGLSFNPLINRLYGLDADQDKIMYFDPPYYNLTNKVSVSAITNDFPSVPAYSSIDRNGNVWVSTFDSFRVLKFDKDLNYLLSATPVVPFALDTTVEGNLILASTIVETDQDNNVWTSFSHPNSSLLIKFDSNGNQIVQATSLSLTSVPVALAIDPNKNVWVANYQTNNIELYNSTNGNILSSISGGFLHPSFMALDRQANVWFTHGYNFISQYDIKTHTLSTWKADPTLNDIVVYNQPYSSDDEYKALHEPEIWSGLSIDAYNRVWIVDGLNNQFAVFKTKNPLNKFISDMMPDVDPLVNSFAARAIGDWTGNRWYQKYATDGKTTDVDLSTPFKIYGIDDFEIAKVNETFDYAKYMRSLALPEILYSNDKMFDEFLTASMGDEVVTNESPGRVSYERIANFVQNHGDIETAEIEQLKSQAEQLSVDTKTFGSGFPAAVTRLLNLFSIPKQRLRGNVAYDEDFERSIKELIEPTDTITVNDLLVAKDKQYGTSKIVVVSPLDNGSTSYPLASLQVSQLRAPLTDNYYFFKYKPDVIGYTGNVVDWDSDYTTVSYSLSTAEDWYGDEGLIDKMFNRLLTKQLFLE